MPSLPPARRLPSRSPALLPLITRPEDLCTCAHAVLLQRLRPQAFTGACKWTSKFKEKQSQNGLQRSKLNYLREVMAPSLAPYKMGIQEVQTTESEVQVIFGT